MAGKRGGRAGVADAAGGADGQARDSDDRGGALVPVGQTDAAVELRGADAADEVVGALRAARLDRARALLEEVRQAGRLHGRPYDRDVLRLVEAVLSAVES
jgi:hypothetical protein